MNIEIIECPRCGSRAYLYEDEHGECTVCGLNWYPRSPRESGRDRRDKPVLCDKPILF